MSNIKQRFGIAACLMLAACAVYPESEGPDRGFVPTATRITFLAGKPMESPIECTPDRYPGECPHIAFQQRATMITLEDGRHAVTLWATRDLPREGTINLLLTDQPDGCIADEGTSDNTGLRHPFRICDREGSVEWTLRAVAGRIRVDFVLE